MKIPQGLTEDEVVGVITKIARRLAPKFTFASYDVEDIEQEAFLIGIAGSIVGTALGLIFAFWLQVKGLDIGDLMKNSTLLFPGVLHAQITPETYYIGIFPGVFSMVLGTMLSGVGIYKRQTAQLFKELEV